MKLSEYFKKYSVNMKMFSEEHGFVYRTILDFASEKRNPSLKLAVEIEDATEGKVKCRDMFIDEKSIKKKQKAKASKKSQ
jgi:hypothetical protein